MIWLAIFGGTLNLLALLFSNTKREFLLGCFCTALLGFAVMCGVPQ